MFNPEDFLDVCRQYASAPPPDVVLEEPYLPFVPSNWNGYLVLAEAQNLSTPDSPYLRTLQSRSPDERMLRLYDAELTDETGIGVGPWDNGMLKLALKAMVPDIELACVAISNAVPWSRRSGQSNENPGPEMQSAAVQFWTTLLEEWKPELGTIVTVGKVPATVTRDAGLPGRRIELRSASPNYIQRIRGMFDRNDLLQRYPEVKQAGDALGKVGWLTDDHVFFACHAVSLGMA